MMKRCKEKQEGLEKYANYNSTFNSTESREWVKLSSLLPKNTYQLF